MCVWQIIAAGELPSCPSGFLAGFVNVNKTPPSPCTSLFAGSHGNAGPTQTHSKALSSLTRSTLPVSQPTGERMQANQGTGSHSSHNGIEGWSSALMLYLNLYADSWLTEDIIKSVLCVFNFDVFFFTLKYLGRNNVRIVVIKWGWCHSLFESTLLNLFNTKVPFPKLNHVAV